jgi:hypothetical protein
MPSSDEARANRRSHELEQRRERERQAPPREGPPWPGSIDEELARVAASREYLAGRPDWESEPRRATKRVREKLNEGFFAKFGKVPDARPTEQKDNQCEQAVHAFEALESKYIDYASKPDASADVAEGLLQAYCDAFAAWASLATAGWPSARELERQQRRHTATWDR